MKFASSTTKLGVFCLISFSICPINGLAANQGSNSGAAGTVPNKYRFVNKSKGPLMTYPARNNNFAIKLQTPPAPKIGPIINKSKPVGIGPALGFQGGEQVVLQTRDIGSFGAKWQSFSDYLTVPKGCDQLPLFLTFRNGPTPAQRFTDLRISLAGKSVATIKDFGGQPTLTRNLTGALGVGDSLLTVQALGPAGAQLNWKFTTPKILVNKVNPNSFAPTDKVIIEGRNFSDRAGVTKVFIDTKPATVVSAKSNSIEIKPPAGLVGGKSNLYVVVGMQKSAPFVITIKGNPEVTGVNMISTAPGQPLTISGTGFSPIAAENVVTIGGVTAEVTAASPTSIQCTVPMALDPMSPAWYLPIKVKTNGMDSKDSANPVTINIQSRVF